MSDSSVFQVMATDFSGLDIVKGILTMLSLLAPILSLKPRLDSAKSSIRKDKVDTLVALKGKLPTTARAMTTLINSGLAEAAQEAVLGRAVSKHELKSISNYIRANSGTLRDIRTCWKFHVIEEGELRFRLSAWNWVELVAWNLYLYLCFILMSLAVVAFSFSIVGVLSDHLQAYGLYSVLFFIATLCAIWVQYPLQRTFELQWMSTGRGRTPPNVFIYLIRGAIETSTNVISRFSSRAWSRFSRLSLMSISRYMERTLQWVLHATGIKPKKK